MSWLLGWVLAWLGAGGAQRAATCFVPEGPVVAAVTWRGVEVRAREGALEVGDLRITACEGLPDPFPAALASDGEHLWVGFRSAGVFAWDHNGFHPVGGLPADGVWALAAQAGQLWVGLGTRGLWQVPAGTDRARPFRHGVLGAQGITALHAAGSVLHVAAGPWGWWTMTGGRATRRARGIFVGCFEGDPVRALPPGRACAQGPAGPASGLPSGHITALATHLGSLYVGTFDAGLARRVGPGFVVVPNSPRLINALLSREDGLWIATPRGLFRLGPEGVKRVPVALPSDHINALATGPDGTLWVGTSQGLAGFGAHGVRVFDRRQGLPGRIVYAVAVAEDGGIWVGTDAGAARIGPEGVVVFDAARGTLPHDWVNALLADKNVVVAGTYDAGAVRLAPDGTSTPIPELAGAWVNPAGLLRLGGHLAAATLGDGLLVVGADGPHRQAGLPAQDVTAAMEVDGALWVGTRGGLVRLPAPRPGAI